MPYKPRRGPISEHCAVPFRLVTVQIGSFKLTGFNPPFLALT